MLPVVGGAAQMASPHFGTPVVVRYWCSVHVAAPPSASAPALRRRMPGVCEDSEALRAARQDATVESAVAVLDATAASGAVDNSAWGSARRVKSLRAGDGRASRCSCPVKVALPAQARGRQRWDKTPRAAAGRVRSPLAASCPARRVHLRAVCCVHGSAWVGSRVTARGLEAGAWR
jgi:hypothetical protein